MSTWIIAIIIIIAVIVLYATNIIPYPVTSLLACAAMVVFKVIPFSTAFAGFGSDVIMLVAGMMVIGNALFETGAAKMLGAGMIRVCGKSERVFLLVSLIFASVMTTFCSNTATIALMMPVVSAAAKANERIRKKNCFMALGMASVLGGGLTMVGSSPQLVVQEILIAGGVRPIGFFEMMTAGLPRVIVLILYFTTIGYALQKKVFTFEETPDEEEAAAKEQTQKWKAYVTLGILAACVVSFVAQLVSVGTTALIGSLACILTGCISWKNAVTKMNWSTLIVLGGAIGFATGLDKSGGGAMIAGFFVRLLGDHIDFFALIAVFVLLSTVLANIMSHTATVSILVPIAIGLTKQLGYDSTMIAIAIILGACMSCVTPIATPPITMTMRAGYRFSDYVKVGGLLNLINYFVTIGAFFVLVRIV